MQSEEADTQIDMDMQTDPQEIIFKILTAELTRWCTEWIVMSNLLEGPTQILPNKQAR